jgi:hypothetical protein
METRDLDWSAILLMLRGNKEYDHGMRIFVLRNIVTKVGKETLFDDLKEQMRGLYRELSKALDGNKGIEGIISDKRLDEIVYLLEDFMEVYYWARRNDPENYG